MNTRREAFTFVNGTDRLVGVLYLPPDRDAVAAVVTTGPLTSVKEQATGNYAQALAERGFAALAFDHRTFGESEGDPRQFENPEGKAGDVSAAVTALAADRADRRPSGRGRRHLCRRRLHGPGRRRRPPHRCLRGSGRLLLRRQPPSPTPHLASTRRRSTAGRAAEEALARDRLSRDDPGSGT